MGKRTNVICSNQKRLTQRILAITVIAFVGATDYSSGASERASVSQEPILSIGHANRRILCPAFSWTPITSTPFMPGPSPQSVVYVVPTSKAKGAQSGPAIVKGQAWECLVKTKTNSARGGKKFRQYYENLYKDYVASTGRYDANFTPLGVINLGGYDFGPASADGPLGGDWGYLFKSGYYEDVNGGDYTKDTVRELALSSTVSNADGSACRADSCPYVRYVVFWSDPISIGEVLKTASWPTEFKSLPKKNKK